MFRHPSRLKSGPPSCYRGLYRHTAPVAFVWRGNPAHIAEFADMARRRCAPAVPQSTEAAARIHCDVRIVGRKNDSTGRVLSRCGFSVCAVKHNTTGIFPAAHIPLFVICFTSCFAFPSDFGLYGRHNARADLDTMAAAKAA